MASANSPPTEERTTFTWFSVRTYLNQRQLDLFLQYRIRSMIRHYAYCYHDSDYNSDGELITPHFHIVLALHRSRTVEDVEKWFDGFHDEKGMHVNYKVIPLSGKDDVRNQFEYLCHLTSGARKEGKHIYSESERIVDDVDFWEPYTYKMSQQNLLQALMRISSGELSLRQACIEYGRDFILHYSHIKVLLEDIQKDRISKF